MTPVPASLAPPVIFFDLDDTLIDRWSAYRGYLHDFVARHPAAFPAERRSIDLRTFQLLDDAAGNDRPTYYRRAAELYPQTGLTSLELSEDYLRHVPAFVAPHPGRLPLLATLRRGRRLAIVTNGESATQRGKLTSSGLDGCFDEVFVSAEVGAHKPDPAIFARILAWAGCPPEQVLFVGDDPLRDVAGAARLGMRTAWVARVWRARGLGAFPAGLPYPDLIIDDIEELPGLLGA